MAGSGPQELRGISKRLVVFLPWLGATEAAVAKYSKLYDGEGKYKVFVHYASVKDFLWPKSGLVAASKVLDEIHTILQEEETQLCGIIIHAFSIGCFFYSLMISQTRRNMDKYGDIWRSISMQIMDSPVLGSTTQMAVGVSKMMSQRSVIASVYKNIILLYFSMAKANTVVYYDDLVAEVRYHAPDVPSLLMTSNDDPMCVAQLFFDFCATWRDSKDVIHKVWQNSKHAYHFLFHPDEYKLLVKNMLKKSFQQENFPVQSKL